METLRLIRDRALPAAANMARDEALLASVIGGAPPALRFYAWDPPAVSLGYFQPIADWERQELARFELVRRPTGGGAILHAEELTYSLAVPGDLTALRGHPNRLYQLAHEAVRDGLRGLGVSAEFFAGDARGNSRRGPFFCFARRHPFDLVVGREKLAGSAQRRRGGCILQHGSIILRRVGPQPCIGVNDRAAQPISAEQLIAALLGEMSKKLGVRLEPGELTADEVQSAAGLELRYASDAWTRQR